MPVLSLSVYRQYDAMAAKRIQTHTLAIIFIFPAISEALFKAIMSLTFHDRPAVESLHATGLIFSKLHPGSPVYNHL